jgi:hypothetical protein
MVNLMTSGQSQVQSSQKWWERGLLQQRLMVNTGCSGVRILSVGKVVFDINNPEKIISR